MTSSIPPSPGSTLVVANNPHDRDTWRPILEAQNQVVLYNPASHALTVTSTNARSAESSATSMTPGPDDVPKDGSCPYCHQPLRNVDAGEDPDVETQHEQYDEHSRVSNYFHLLAAANRGPSMLMSSAESPQSPQPGAETTPSQPLHMAEGYFQAFFREVKRLGMGANGTVLLCEHVLDGNPLGKIPA